MAQRPPPRRALSFQWTAGESNPAREDRKPPLARAAARGWLFPLPVPGDDVGRPGVQPVTKFLQVPADRTPEAHRSGQSPLGEKRPDVTDRNAKELGDF